MTLDSLNIARGYFLKAVLNLDKLILTVGIWVYQKKKEWSSLNTFEFQTNCIQWMQIHGDDDDVVTQTLAK